MRHRDGRERWFDLNARLVRDASGRPAGVEGFVQDITERRAATQAREQALAAAEDLARARREFIANMSHELRTPLNGVLGYAQIGLSQCGDEQKSRKAFTAIAQSGRRLAEVVDAVLDFSRIEVGRLSIEPQASALDAFVDTVVDTVAARARAKALSFDVERAADLPARCIFDPRRLRQVLDVVLDNAVKFTSAGGVSLRVCRSGAWLVFAVSDTGIGMDDAQLRQLFTPFQQADGSLTRPFGGAGLGLAIAKRLLDLMGGEIDVSSAPGKGCTVEIRVPCVDAAGGSIAA
jgi:signal transduction histidine kinase